MPIIQLTFSLRYPLQTDWTHDRDYNDRVHEILMAAHTDVFASTPAADQRPRVEVELLDIEHESMSRRQRMLLYFLLAHCARARDLTRTNIFYEVLRPLSRAEELAIEIQDRGALVDVHELRGTVHRAVSLYPEAAEEFALTLRLMRELSADGASYDPDFEVTLTAKAAAMDYLLGEFPRALEYLQRAAVLLPLAQLDMQGQGTVAWTFALLDRQRNAPQEALWHVEVAVGFYRQLGPSNSTCRILSLAAEISMDVAESAAGDEPAARRAYLAQAEAYIQEAWSVGRAVADDAGVELTNLSAARLERLRDPKGAKGVAARIRSVIKRATQLSDESLLVAAQTALGVELLARGKRPDGRRWLAKAVATAKKLHTPGLAYHAQRRLRRDEGRNA